MADNSFKIKNSINIAASDSSVSEIGDLRRRSADDELAYVDGSGSESIIVTSENITSYETGGAPAASNVTVTPAGTITSTDVQAALEELDTDIQNIPTGGGSASDISFTPAGNIAATDVQAALEELDSEKEPTVTKGNLTEATSNVLTITGGTGAVIGSGASIEVDQADTSNDGYLSSTDWNTFNNKSDYTDPLTTDGDLLVRDAGTTTRLGIGSESQVLTVSSGAVAWADAAASGGGSGDKNYFEGDGSFGLFESDTTGVSVYDDGGAYVDGTGGTVAGEITLTTSSNPVFNLQGSQSLLVQKSASDASGFGISFTMNTIDQIDRGKDLVFSFASRFGVLPAPSPNDWTIKAYDITNGDIITGIRALNGPDDLSLTGNKTTFRYAIPTVANVTAIRVSIHLENDNSVGTAYDWGIDEVTFGPQTPVSVVNIGDWQSYTPTITGFGTPTNVEFYQRQIGNTAYIRGKFTSGTSIATEARVSIPFTSADTSIIPTIQVCGYGAKANNTATNTPILIEPSVGYLTFGVQGASNSGLTKINANNFLSSGQTVSFFAEVPIANASSNIAVGTAGTFRMAPILAGGTRVTGSAPTRLGEYRSYRRNASAKTFTETNGAPTAAPSAADGVAIYSGNGWGSADSNNQPSRYDIFVGKNKQVKVEFYANAGKTGVLYTDMHSAGSTGAGCDWSYDPTTGILSVVQPVQISTVSVQRVGLDSNTDFVTDGFFDIIVSENVQAIGFDPQNKFQTKTLSADVFSTGAIADLTFTGLTVGKVYRISGHIDLIADNAATPVAQIEDSLGNIYGVVRRRNIDTSSETTGFGVNAVFTAVDTQVRLNATSASGNDGIRGNGTREETFLTLEELNNYQEVSSFT